MFGVFGEGTPHLWSHNVTNITASLCLASGFISLVTIPDLLVKHSYSWDTSFFRRDSYKLEPTSFLLPETLLLQGEWLEGVNSAFPDIPG